MMATGGSSLWCVYRLPRRELTVCFCAQDDKGSTLIVVFGVPPFSHEDDPYRAVRSNLDAALLICCLLPF
jgi:hypothetical protein